MIRLLKHIYISYYNSNTDIVDLLFLLFFKDDNSIYSSISYGYNSNENIKKFNSKVLLLFFV